MNRSIVPLSVAAALILSGCGLLASRPAPPPEPGDRPAIAAVAEQRGEYAAAGASLYDIDAEASDVRIYVFRGGRLPQRGKNHVISVPRLEGFVAIDGDFPKDTAFALGFRADEMLLDAETLRAETGDSFAEPLTDEQVAATRENMLGESVLDAEKHPEIVLRSVEIGGDWPMLVARFAVDLHGKTVEVDSLMEVRRDADQLVGEGSFVLRQSDAGITPMSVLGGLIGLQDPLAIRYRIVAREAAGEASR